MAVELARPDDAVDHCVLGFYLTHILNRPLALGCKEIGEARKEIINKQSTELLQREGQHTMFDFSRLIISQQSPCGGAMNCIDMYPNTLSVQTNCIGTLEGEERCSSQLHQTLTVACNSATKAH